jgi:invasion protein IalB
MPARRSVSSFVCILALAAASIAPSPAWAQRQTLGTFGDWTAFADGKADKRLCYVGSAPKKAEGTYKARGDTYVLVTHRPGEKVFGEVSVEAGYSYKPNSDVEVVIDGKSFKMFTQGGNAWAADPSGDEALVAAMRAGKQMIVKGTSSRGTLTTDTYSLVGFTQAYNAINKACPGK